MHDGMSTLDDWAEGKQNRLMVPFSYPIDLSYVTLRQRHGHFENVFVSRSSACFMEGPRI